jgi:multicomponent Na+:H+ antiporter subunit G
MDFLPLAGAVIVFIGSLFLLLAAIGILRMPDAYNRLQAGTKATTLGVILTLLGLGLYEPAWLPKLIVIILFVLITNPLSEGSVRDELADAKAPPAAVPVKEEPAT